MAWGRESEAANILEVGSVPQNTHDEQSDATNWCEIHSFLYLVRKTEKFCTSIGKINSLPKQKIREVVDTISGGVQDQAGWVF